MDDATATAVRTLTALEAIPLESRNLPDTTYELLTRAATQHGDAPALHLLPGGQDWDQPETWSYNELLHRINQAANLFDSLGLEFGGVVGLLLPNTPSMYPALFGAQAIGIANPVNPMLATEHIVDIFQLTGASVLIAAGPELDPEGWRKACEVAAALPDLRALVSVGGKPRDAPATWVGDFGELSAAQPGQQLTFNSRRNASDISAYFHTGGTTGTPKVAPHTHFGEISVAWALGEHEVFGGDTVVLAGLPLFHVNAILITTLTPFLRGRTAVSLGMLGYRDRLAMADFWRIVERYRVTTFSAVPTVYASLPPVPIGVDIASLRGGIVGAAPLPSTVRSTFETTTGVPMVEGYGLTEATCANTFSPLVGARVGSVGLRLPYQQIKAVHVDDSGRPIGDCESGETGVLAIKGPCVFPGYLKIGPSGPAPDPSDVIVDGWLLTGDLGRLDDDGFVWLTGRAKDVIIRGGHNIDPRLVEDALLTHPDVVEAAVVPRPDAHSGEVPAAFLVLRAGADIEPDELIRWAELHAPEPAAVPRFVHIVPSIPVTAVGKVHKVTLIRESVNQVVVQELRKAGVAGEVSVVDREGLPHAQIQLVSAPDSEQLRDVVERLGQYSFSHSIC